MRKILNNKLYNTDTAKYLAEFSSDYPKSDFNWYSETLYQKKTGEYFLYGEGGPNTHYAQHENGMWGYGQQIIPITEETAKKWAEENLDTDTYMKIFGPVPEDDSKFVPMSVNLLRENYNKLKRESENTRTPMSTIINGLIQKL